MLTIAFNQQTSVYAEQSNEVNLMIIRHNELYINDLLRFQGYVYLNQIYELLGVKWNPEWDNLCRTYDGHNHFKFLVHSVDDGLEITID